MVCKMLGTGQCWALRSSQHTSCQAKMCCNSALALCTQNALARCRQHARPITVEGCSDVPFSARNRLILRRCHLVDVPSLAYDCHPITASMLPYGCSPHCQLRMLIAGSINIPYNKQQNITFFMDSDDGALLSIDGNVIISKPGAAPNSLLQPFCT